MNRAENSMQMLNRMASNLECVPFILSNLQNDLLSFISITEKYSDGNKLHKPLANLLNRILQVNKLTFICNQHKLVQFSVFTKLNSLYILGLPFR